MDLCPSLPGHESDAGGGRRQQESSRCVRHTQTPNWKRESCHLVLMRSSLESEPSAFPIMPDKDAFRPLYCPLPLCKSKKRSGLGQIRALQISAQLCAPSCSFPGCLLQFSMLLSHLFNTEIHLNVCFSTVFSKSRLNFCFPSDRFWMAGLSGCLITTVAGTSVCPDPPPRKPCGVALWGAAWIGNMTFHPLTFCFSLPKS